MQALSSNFLKGGGVHVGVKESKRRRGQVVQVVWMQEKRERERETNGILEFEVQKTVPFGQNIK